MVPESPRWLLSKNKLEAALKVFATYIGTMPVEMRRTLSLNSSTLRSRRPLPSCSLLLPVDGVNLLPPRAKINGALSIYN
ncbi:hypothetical protein L211DRAFT_834535 [Terfezia boudieri ATCC MYA-4762]|uniref:Uncharacterized protein n=1 Tax=Terfezia boudieri ATCC MYA-4762 TaxID=1051890 RepID=A0A3N4LY14_9PEZI|nr:hypothetical protein L211DRAFT_834535 [Terfezia boudieri ATCC MYA-4762]